MYALRIATFKHHDSVIIIMQSEAVDVVVAAAVAPNISNKLAEYSLYCITFSRVVCAWINISNCISQN